MAVRSIEAFQKKNKSGREACGKLVSWTWKQIPTERNASSFSLADKRSSLNIASFLRGGVFQVDLDLRKWIVGMIYMHHITLSRDFHRLTTHLESFNRHDSREYCGVL